jgi:hypothetical protein
VRAVRVRLEDHYTGEEINAAVGQGGAFAQAFPGETAGELDALRELFRRKALVARQARVCETLRAHGATWTEVAAMTLEELPDDPGARRCVELRAQLGLSSGGDAAAFVAPDDTPIAAEDLARWLRVAGLVRTSLEANGGICRSLLAVRYGLSDQEEIAA